MRLASGLNVKFRITRRRLHCDWTTGLLAGLPILFGLPLARVDESECQTRGDAQCLYTVTWDAELAAEAADPQKRVTALEAQLVAMSERLHGAYATAGDIVSTENLETVLQRIVERAADAVRAPSHILAIRTEPSAELQVYSHGIDERKAYELATHGVSADAASDDSILVAEVASGRRSYGELIARYPGSVEFFPQDRELLNLYAKNAAAVLDMSVALEQSTRRHEQVSALRSLAHAVAQAGTTEEIAERLVAVVPDVVDCDRVGVWRWDYLEQSLTILCGSGQSAAQAEYLSGLAIHPDDTPHLEQMIASPRPRFFDEGTEDQFMRILMSKLGSVALAIVQHHNCDAHPQSMGDYEPKLWTQGRQLFCPAKKGGDVVLAIDVHKSGQYRVRLLATAAPDYGQIKVAIDGTAIRETFDLYSGRVCPSGSLELGVHELSAGRHQLRCTTVGKDAASGGFNFGLDAIDLMPAK